MEIPPVNEPGDSTNASNEKSEVPFFPFVGSLFDGCPFWAILQRGEMFNAPHPVFSREAGGGANAAANLRAEAEAGFRCGGSGNLCLDDFELGLQC